jgi:hypothetical protein
LKGERVEILSPEIARVGGLKISEEVLFLRTLALVKR